MPEERRSFYEDQQGIGMITADGKVKNDPSLVRVDDFVFDEKVCLGTGCDGSVYLAQHIPTKIFVAVKAAETLATDNENNEYQFLVRLNRLFAYYSLDLFIDGRKSSLRKQTYAFIPLVEGDIIWRSARLNEEAYVTDKIVSYDPFKLRFSLMRSLLAELRYLAQCGIYQPEPISKNILITDDFQQITVVDFGGAGRVAHQSYLYNRVTHRSFLNNSSIDPSSYDVSSYTEYFTDYLLGHSSRDFVWFTLSKSPYIKEFKEKLNSMPVRSLQTVSDAVDELEKAWKINMLSGSTSSAQ
jgi:hypothetical protein